MRRVLVLLLVSACGRIQFDPRSDADTTADDGTAPPPPLHRYRFAGDLTDDFGGSPLDAPNGAGEFVPGGGYRFGANAGVTLVRSAFPASEYTMHVELSFSTTGGWRKIFDVRGLTIDEGLYVFEHALQMVIVPNGAVAPDFVTTTMQIADGQRLRLTISRSAAGAVVAYLNGAPATAERSAMSTVPSMATSPFEFVDGTDILAPNASTVAWFIDDAATNSEFSAGDVGLIEIWPIVLTAAEVAAL